jgi:hypothetical protein
MGGKKDRQVGARSTDEGQYKDRRGYKKIKARGSKETSEKVEEGRQKKGSKDR